MPVPRPIRWTTALLLALTMAQPVACDSDREEPALKCSSDEQCPANGQWRCGTAGVCERCVGSCGKDAGADGGVDGDSDASLPDALTSDSGAVDAGPAVESLLSETFECDSAPPAEWTFSGFVKGTPGWAVDKDPASPGAVADCSLNFNDGTGYVCPGAVKLEGTATSPSINATNVTKGQTLLATFQLAGTWSTETDVSSNPLEGVVVQASTDDKTWTQVAAWPSPGLNWSLATADLTSYAGDTFKLRFRFYATKCQKESGTGPFIDNLVVRTGHCQEAPDCEDGNPCTLDGCDAATGSCQHSIAILGKDPDGSDGITTEGKSCDDGQVCTTGDLCVSGQCKAGSLNPCIDDNPCSIDTCIPGTGCTHVLAGDGVGCDDLNACTGPDSCTKGICAGGDVVDGSACDDGVNCTVDTCKSGVCTSKKADNGTECKPGEPCHVGICVSSKCVAQEVPNGTDCDDDDPCTKSSQCVDGLCAGAVDTEMIGKACEDGDLCTLTGECSQAGSCVVQAKDCDDSKVCTVDSCDSKAGVCKNEGVPGSPCDDDIACTTKDACNSANQCIGEAVAEGGACDSGVPCHTAVCNKGICKGSADPSLEGSKCEDNDKCTNKDVCVNGTCESGIQGCDDQNPCTLDTCLNATTLAAACTHTQLNEGDSCDDGDPCTAKSGCNSGKCNGESKCSQKVTLLTDTFSCGSEAGWTFNNTGGDSGAGWAVDGTPAEPKPKSAGCSLNFNNGKDFASNQAVSGTATSLAMNLPANGVPVIRFWSWHQTQADDNHDKRSILVSSDGFQSIILGKQLFNGQDAGKWVQHELSLDALVGKTIQIRFAFESVDTKFNAGAGWFIDDLVVQAAVLKL